MVVRIAGFEGGRAPSGAGRRVAPWRAAAGMALALVGCQAPGRMLGMGDASPDTLVLTPLAATPEVRWAFPCDLPGALPALARTLQDVPGCFPVEDDGGGALTIESGWLSCRDAHTGERRWTLPIRSSVAQVVPEGGFLFLHDRADDSSPLGPARYRLVRVDARDGSVRGSWNGVPAADVVRVESGRVVFLSRFALAVADGLSGRVLWSREYDATSESAAEIMGAAVGTGGLAVEVKSYRRSLPSLTLLDLETGQPRWSKEGSPLSVQGGHVISVNPASRGFAVRGVADGSELRADALEGWVEGHEAFGDGLLLHRARQLVIEPAHIGVGPVGAEERPPAYTARQDLLARDVSDGGVRWFVPCPAEDRRLRVFVSGDRFGMITAAARDAAGTAERLTVHDLSSGVPLCSVDAPSGIVKVHLRKDRALVRTSAGWVHAVEWTRR